MTTRSTSSSARRARSSTTSQTPSSRASPACARWGHVCAIKRVVSCACGRRGSVLAGRHLRVQWAGGRGAGHSCGGHGRLRPRVQGGVDGLEGCECVPLGLQRPLLPAELLGATRKSIRCLAPVAQQPPHPWETRTLPPRPLQLCGRSIRCPCTVLMQPPAYPVSPAARVHLTSLLQPWPCCRILLAELILPRGIPSAPALCPGAPCTPAGAGEGHDVPALGLSGTGCRALLPSCPGGAGSAHFGPPQVASITLTLARFGKRACRTTLCARSRTIRVTCADPGAVLARCRWMSCCRVPC